MLKESWVIFGNPSATVLAGPNANFVFGWAVSLCRISFQGRGGDLQSESGGFIPSKPSGDRAEGVGAEDEAPRVESAWSWDKPIEMPS